MQQANILLADDDAVIRLDLRTMLESLGHQVVAEADNGETACHLARSLRPDVLIFDVRMPKMNGLEAAEVVAKERLGAVILLTAYSDVPVIEQASKAGVLGYLVKPFRQQELHPAIEIALSRYREMLALENALDTVQEQAEAGRLVARARRVLTERYCISEQEAYRRLQAQALNANRTLREVAEAVLLTEEITVPTGTTRRRTG